MRRLLAALFGAVVMAGLVAIAPAPARGHVKPPPRHGDLEERARWQTRVVRHDRAMGRLCARLFKRKEPRTCRWHRRQHVWASRELGETRAALRAERKRERLARRRTKAVRIARRNIGVPYVWGGAGPRGFDCSGLVVYVMRKLGIRLPHHAASQLGYGRKVTGRQLQKGDLVYFHGAEHMGMYIGNGRFIHAPHTGSYVQISGMSGRSLYAARRVIN